MKSSVSGSGGTIGVSKIGPASSGSIVTNQYCGVTQAATHSRQPSGPFFDRLGTPLQHGGGTVILSERGMMFGPGGPSIHDGVLAHHFYDGTANGDFRLSIRRIDWDAQGWPVIANR